MDRSPSPRPFPIRTGRKLWLWAALPLWLLAFAAAHLLEHAPFASLWFPPTAVTFAALVLFGARGWWPVALAAFLSQFWTLDRLDLAWTPLTVLGGGLGFALAHTLPFAALAFVLHRQVGRDPLGRFGPSALFLLLGGGAVACLLTALGGSAVLVLCGLAETIDLRWSVVPWMIGDYAGLLALGPLLVEAMRQRVAPADAATAGGLPTRRFALRLALLLGPILLVMTLAALAPQDDAVIFAIVFSLVVQQWISHTQTPVQALSALALAALLVAALTAGFGLGRHALVLQFALIALALTTYSALSFLGLRDDHRRLTSLLATDPLTTASSRAHFGTLVERTMAASAAASAPLSLLMLDLDHLKRINDARGHGAGDEALRRFAAVCREHLRADDALGRLGGDEFAMCLPGLGADAASARGMALLAALAAASTDDLPLAASIGVAQMRPGENYASLVQRADEALMQAKREGRGRLVAAPQG